MPRPHSSEYAPYFDTYVKLVSEEDVLPVLQNQQVEFTKFIQSIPDRESTVLHEPYTWTIKQVLGHLIDAEVVFGYRALRFARGDQTPVSSFDENMYVANGNFNRASLPDLAEQFAALRRSHVYMFGGLTQDIWDLSGHSGSSLVSVRAIAYILVGHVRHHGAIIAKRLKRV